ncbi:MAG: betaine/proline/choline family ABC transporter ATP-binding protein [Syntrophaceticus sp.]
MVKFQNVSKVYANGTCAVQNLNLTIEKGELVVLIGPSGCGKTTTLKMVNRLIEPTSGKILVGGKDIQNENPVQLRRRIGYVIQQIGLFPHMTIAQNIGLVPKLLGTNPREIDKKVDQLLEMGSLDPQVYRNRYPKQLSGGEQQRVGVLRALAADPDVILMDEPFGALDPISREQLQDELKRLQDSVQKTILFVTHDMDEALKLADRIVLMKDGEVVQNGSPEDLIRNPADDFVREFIGEKRLLRNPEDVLVEEVMLKTPVTGKIEMGLVEALRQMQQHKVNTLLIIDKEDKLSGILTLRAVQKAIRDSSRFKAKDILEPVSESVTPQDTVLEAARQLDASSFGFIPVIDENQHLQGLLNYACLVSTFVDVIWPNGDYELEQEERENGCNPTKYLDDISTAQ